MSVTGIIDPPGAFAPAYEWRAFLVELRKLPKAPDVDAAIEQAEEHLRSVDDEGGEDDFSDLEG